LGAPSAVPAGYGRRKGTFASASRVPSSTSAAGGGGVTVTGAPQSLKASVTVSSDWIWSTVEVSYSTCSYVT